MRLPWSDHIAESERAPGQSEHMTVGRDQRFPREFARAVGRDREQRAIVLVRLGLTDIAVYAAAGGVQNGLRPGYTHRFDDIVGEPGAFAKIDLRFGCST